MKRFLRNLNVLNLLLAAAMIFSLNHGFSGRPGGGTPSPGSSGGPSVARRLPGIMARGGLENVKFTEAAKNGWGGEKGLDSYLVISSQNLFNPQRETPVEKPAPAAPPPKPNLVLRGILIDPGLRLAYIGQDGQRPGSAPVQNADMMNSRPSSYGYPARHAFVQGVGGKAKAYRKGDSIGGFVLTDIKPDQVRLVRGKETMRIFLSEPVKDLR